MFFISLLILTCATIFFYKYYAKRYEDILKLPGPSRFNCFRDVYKASLSEGVMSYFLSVNEVYGPIVKIWTNPFKPTIITTDMEYVNKIYKDDRHHFSPSVRQLTFLQDGISSNPNYEWWKHDKQIIIKAMNKEYVSEMMKNCCEKCEKLICKIRAQGKVDIDETLKNMFLDVMIDTFHHQSIELKDEDVKQYDNARKEFYNHLLVKMNSFFLTFFHIFTKNRKLSKKFHNVIVNFAKDWLEKFKAIEETSRNNKNLVYAMLNNGMPEARVVANINAFIQAGQDTISIPLALAFLHIAREPTIQKRIQEEIESVLGRNTSAISLNELNEMRYLQAVIMETIRIHFPIPFLDRKLSFDVQIGNTKLPKGTIVMFHLGAILKSAQHYKDPLVFNPDRFLNNDAQRSLKAFVAFGYGLKACTGKQTSYAVMKLLVVKLLREFEVYTLDDKFSPKFVTELLRRSANGVPIEFKERRGNNLIS